ncbi:MAG: hypothetical protein WCY01_09240 [Alkalispirochaeta sp.]|jgi:hypothetical protein
MEELTFEVLIPEDRAYIRINIHGSVTIHNIFPVHDAMNTAMVETGIDRFLVD